MDATGRAAPPEAMKALRSELERRFGNDGRRDLLFEGDPLIDLPEPRLPDGGIPCVDDWRVVERQVRWLSAPSTSEDLAGNWLG